MHMYNLSCMVHSSVSQSAGLSDTRVHILSKVLLHPKPNPSQVFLQHEANEAFRQRSLGNLDSEPKQGGSLGPLKQLAEPSSEALASFVAAGAAPVALAAALPPAPDKAAAATAHSPVAAASPVSASSARGALGAAGASAVVPVVGVAGDGSGSMPNGNGQPTIFMSIAAYREQRGPRSIAGAFKMAKYPDRIFVGLYQQWDPEKVSLISSFSPFSTRKNRVFFFLLLFWPH